MCNLDIGCCNLDIGQSFGRSERNMVNDMDTLKCNCIWIPVVGTLSANGRTSACKHPTVLNITRPYF